MFCTDKLSPYPHLKLLGKYVTCEKAACVCMCVCVGMCVHMRRLHGTTGKSQSRRVCTSVLTPALSSGSGKVITGRRCPLARWGREPWTSGLVGFPPLLL